MKLKEKMKPLVSVIVPVWNVEDTLECCLQSLLHQSYRNIEIIAVNDASPDRCMHILNDYAGRFPQIKVVNHDFNKGLFMARISGVRQAKGDYIAFVDSDDYVSVDWYRLLVDNALAYDSDMVMGNTVSVDKDGNRYVYNSNRSQNKLRVPLYGEDIFDWLVRGEGLDFSRHVVWNKLYSRRLFERCMPFYKRLLSEHLTMTEDIAFSFVLYYFAQSMSFLDHDCYFYNRNEKSATVASQNLQKISKNVADLTISFGFVESFLKERGIYEKYRLEFAEWKDRYFRWWSPSVHENTKEDEPLSIEVKKKFFDFFGKREFETCRAQDDSFTNTTVPWNDSLEKIKRMIASENIKVVSFDIFDTLIVRPFLKPTDIWQFMQEDFEKLFHIQIAFSELRISAEKHARESRIRAGNSCNEVTLTEIYLEMAKWYSLSKEKCLKMRDIENAFELRYCYVRSTGRELYEMAISCGKIIILTSDMYLEEETIKKILKTNGYEKHQKLFLSSSYRKLKYNGDLYREAFFSFSNYLPEEFMHIGDNWNVDYEAAKKLGIKACFFPKTSDILFNRLSDVYTGNSINQAFNNENSIIDMSIILKDPRAGILYAIAANLSFDNPFVSFRPDSNYNRDPLFVGLFPLGMHMLGLIEWMKEILREYKGHTVHFIARDGYLPKKVYDMAKKYITDLPDSDYIWLSRKSMIPVDIQSPHDLYRIKGNIEYLNQSPESIFRTYSAVLKEPDVELAEKFAEYGIQMNQKFTDEKSFDFFIKKLVLLGFDDEKAKKNLNMLKGYLSSKIRRGDITFDLGYSGKIQAGICRALSFPVDVIFLHKDKTSADKLAGECGFRIHSYYNFTPPMSGIVNEFIFSDYHPSCIGYTHDEEKGIFPVWEKKPIAYQEKYLLDEMARGCLKFVEEFYQLFGDKLGWFSFDRMDTSLMYEKMLMNDKPVDIDMFEFCGVEDEYYGGIAQRSVADLLYWQLNDKKVIPSGSQAAAVTQTVPTICEPENLAWELYNKKGMEQKGMFQKFLYWFVVDKTMFKKRLREHFRRQ